MTKSVKFLCAGPVLGTWSEDEAKAIGRPDIAGHRKRGLRKRKFKVGEVTVDLPMRCRKNLTALIAALPQDGNEHEIKCPKCGNISRVIRTPAPNA